jgi:cell division protein ZapA
LHRIRVLGRELHVRSTASPERVRQIEEYINSRIEELESSTTCNDPLKIAILALLNIVESYLDISSESVNRGKTDDERISRLLQHIEDSTK